MITLVHVLLLTSSCLSFSSAGFADLMKCQFGQEHCAVFVCMCVYVVCVSVCVCHTTQWFSTEKPRLSKCPWLSCYFGLNNSVMDLGKAGIFYILIRMSLSFTDTSTFIKRDIHTQPPWHFSDFHSSSAPPEVKKQVCITEHCNLLRLLTKTKLM